MKKKILIFSVLTMFILVGTFSAAQQIVLKSEQGSFNAVLGLNREDRPSIFLDGDFIMRGRMRVVSGTYTLSSSDEPGRFRGLFMGNVFYITMSGYDRIIFGKIREKDDHSTFNGIWNSRGLDSLGWITGEFIIRG